MTPLAGIGVFSTPLGRVFLIVHLLVAVFTLGAVTHHWWLLTRRREPQPLLAKYARWMAIGYALAWLAGVVIYPSYNVMIRKPPIGILEATAQWAVGLFEIKEHVGTIALVMLPWLVLSARGYGGITRLERASYLAASWVFTIFVYYSFITGSLVAAVKSF